MGLSFIVAAFLVLLIGALGLAIGFGAANASLAAISVVLFTLTAWVFVRCLRIGVVISAKEFVIRNLFRTHRLAWSQVGDVRPEQIPGFASIGPDHIVLSVGVVDPSLTRIQVLATRTAIGGSGVRLFPLFAVLDVHADKDGITVDHRLPDGSLLPS